MKGVFLLIKYRHFSITKKGDGYLVVNTDKPFKKGHTHVNRHDVAEILCKLAHRKQMPKSKSKWFIESLIRISDDIGYVNRLRRLI